ncbi:hypothetical protein J6590_008112 [Homalodisca vitripennis]|nr:hypothetical protein J6590_008112 [Homalodisca vitripennis]
MNSGTPHRYYLTQDTDTAVSEYEYSRLFTYISHDLGVRTPWDLPLIYATDLACRSHVRFTSLYS